MKKSKTKFRKIKEMEKTKTKTVREILFYFETNKHAFNFQQLKSKKYFAKIALCDEIAVNKADED